MRACSLLVGLSAILMMGGSCTIDFNPPPGDTTLDRASANIAISARVGDSDAVATADVRNALGGVFEFGEGQSISVNGHTLSGPNEAGQYSRTIDAADTYTVRVSEPTRGVETTSIAAPQDFSIRSPADRGDVSLSGFELTWTRPDDSLNVTIDLSQTLFGETNTASFGPVTDTGSFTFSAAQLHGFRQGADLTITITKAAERQDINGLRAGSIRVELSRTRRATPAP